MAKRNRNRKNKKTSNNEEKIKIENKNKDNEVTGEKTPKKKEKVETEKVEIEKVENENKNNEVKEEKTPKKKEKKKTGLFNQVLLGTFAIFLSLPTGYYFLKISPEHIAEIKNLKIKLVDVEKEKKTLESNLKNKEQLALINKEDKKNSEKVNEKLLTAETKVIVLEKKLQEASKTKNSLEEEVTLIVTKGKKVKDELEALKSASHLKEEASKVKLEEKTGANVKLNAELVTIQAKVTALENKLLKETKMRTNLEEQLMFIVTKGKELEDEFEVLKVKEQESKEKLKKETQNSVKLNEGLVATETEITVLKEKLLEEIKDNNELQKKLMFVVTKGKELEDRFKELNSSIKIK